MLARPVSATGAVTAWAGVAGLALSSGYLLLAAPAWLAGYFAALFIAVVTAVVATAAELFVSRSHLRPGTGMDWNSHHLSLRRTAVKYVGFVASLGFIGGLYWLLPEYTANRYARYMAAVDLVLPAILVLAPLYIVWVDAKMVQPRDGFWHFGQMCLLRWRQVDWPEVQAHARAWLVKGFFLPLMFTYMSSDVDWLLRFDFSRQYTFDRIYELGYRLLFFIDVALVTVGYVMSFRVLDTHVRSTDATTLGWVSALICYEPFWAFVSRSYLHYQPDMQWGHWFAGHPVLYAAWGSTILVLCGIYVWATVAFGLRFSNLTNRGIITSGPYRWVKHPAYLAKNLSWWLIAMPWMVGVNLATTLQQTALLAGLSGVYWLRAKTEERHLLADPDYEAYCRWLAQHGLWARMRNLTSYDRHVTQQR